MNFIAHITDNLPTFLGIGAQKAGTTWLYEMLKKHPEICVPSQVKELMFFDVQKNYSSLGIEGYLSYFHNCDGNRHKAIGEITPGYLWTAPFCKEKYAISQFRINTPKRVYENLGSSIKLIVLLRNPVKRAVSAYLHHLYKKRYSLNESILDIGQRHGIIHMGFYYRHLIHWMKYFPLTSFNIAIYEQVTKNKNDYLKNLFDFLGVDREYIPPDQNKRYQKKFDYEHKTDGIYIIQNTQKTKVVSRDELKALYEIFEEDIFKLKKDFGLDVSEWAAPL